MSLTKLVISHSLQWCAYNNIRASLVIVLVSVFEFSDAKAFTIYSTMIALGDINGLAGAFYGDKITGHYLTWLFGAAAIAGIFLYSSTNMVINQQSIIIILNLIACTIGISRCNGTSLVYSKINNDISKERRNSINSLLYMVLIIASFIAYSISGIITQKYGLNMLLFSSGIITSASILIFIQSEYKKILEALLKTPNLIRKILTLILGSLGIISFGFISFYYTSIVNITLWIVLCISLLFILNHSHKSTNNYSFEEKTQVKTFIYYLIWLILYGIFERQFGMIMPLFLSRHFDNNFFGIYVPITNIMSIFQINTIIFSLIFYKIKIHDKISNGLCLIVGFSASLIGFLILYSGCLFQNNYIVPRLAAILPIILFSIADLFVLNRIFSICRTAPRRIHAITSGIMMLGVACSFHGAKIIARIMAVNTELISDKSLSILVYQRGFLINGILLLVLFILVICSYKFKSSESMLKSIS